MSAHQSLKCGFATALGDGRLSVRDRRLDLPAVADDARVREQAFDVAGPVAGDHIGVETGECDPEGVAASEDRPP